MNPQNYQNEPDPPWWLALIAAALFAIAAYVHHYFTVFELEGGSRRMNWVLALLYDIGGKWLPVAGFVGLGIFAGYLTYREYRRRGSWR